MVNAVQITAFTKWTVVTCYSCGIPFAVPKEIDDEWLRQRSARTFYCPNGHGQCYTGQSNEAALKAAQKELQNERKKREWAEQEARNVKQERDRAVAERDHKERQRRSEKGFNTRLRRRVGHGVCPCCNRSFANLQRHMAGQHPNFAKQMETALT